MKTFNKLSRLGIVFALISSMLLFGSSAYANSALTSVHIVQTLWEGDSAVPSELQSNNFDFIALTSERIGGDDMVFLDHAGRTFQLTADGHPDLVASIIGGFSTSSGKSGFVFSVENRGAMAAGVVYALSAPLAESPYEWHAEGVTVTKPGGTPVPDDNVPGTLDRIEANEREMMLTSGQTKKLQVYSIDTNGIEKEITKDKKTIYRTDSASVAEVNSGVVKAGKQEGTANITISNGGKKTVVKVIVASKTVTALKSSSQELILETDEAEQIKLTASFSDGSVKDVTTLADWTTDNSAVAEVDGGEILAVEPGLAVVTAYYNGKSIEIEVEVEAAFWEDDFNELIGLEASNKNIRMNTDEEKVLQIYALYEDGTREEVTDGVLWQTSKSDVADVESGLLISFKSGKATITATYEDRSLQLTVTVVKEKDIKALIASTKKAILKRGQEKELTLTAIYEDGTKSDITEKAEWTVRNEDIAEVDVGVVTGVRKGSTVVQAKYKSKFVNIIVQVK